MLLDTPVCDFGWKAPDFTLADPDGNTFALQDHLADKGLLIMFICNHCPYVKRIAERLVADTATLMAEGVNVLAIMSNDYQEYESDSPENMKVFAQQNGFKFPYLVDEDQSVGQAYGAVCTPDFFGFNSSGELQYRGNIDELLPAMQLVGETGQGPRQQTPSMGCSIKWR
jgi:peroxiredoxin